MQFHLDPDIDPDRLGRGFRRHRRATIAPFLKPEDAELLRAHVAGRDDWQLQMKGEGSTRYRFDRRDIDQWPPERVDALRRIVAPVTPQSFSHVYDRILISDPDQRPEEGTLLGAFDAFLSSNKVIDLINRLLGDGRVDHAYSFCSRYGPGDYLTIHNDKKHFADSRRVVAFVLGLTPGWRPEWGGTLLFHDKGGGVKGGICPKFNALNLFAVPQDHSVSVVAPFAPTPRLSISGWFLGSTTAER